MRDIEEIEEEQAKRDTLVRVEGSDLIATCRNRRIGNKDNPVKIAELSLRFPGAASVPEYIMQASIKMTLIRVQDDARRTMSVEEIAALDGTTIDAAEFWAQRSDRKARTVKPISFEKASIAVAKASASEQAQLMKAMLAARPELAALLK